MLAALLAHEISHTALGHGLVSLASYRMGDLAMYYAVLSTQRTNVDNKETAALFSAAVHDFVSLISVQGYSHTMEYEADFHAVRMLHEANYDPAALEAFIQALGTSNDENARQYSNQHPLPNDRIARLSELRQSYAQKDMRENALRAMREASQFDPGYPASERSVLEYLREVGNNTSGSIAPLEYTRRERFAHMRLLF
jgi:predicted Zn-dependent protease